MEVSGAATMVDASQSKVAVTVQQEVLNNLPKGRSFQTLIPLAPGARAEALQSGSTTGSAASSGTGYQIDGASDGENVFLVDGVNVTQIQNGGVGKNYQMEFIDEVQVKTSSFEAEFGGALGGVINVVPKKGSNEWHGSLLTYLSSNAFNANNTDRSLTTNPTLPSLNTTTRLDATPEYFMANKDQQVTVEPGYQAGGPIWKNKLWIFSSYIPSISTQRRLTTFTSANPGPRNLTSTTTTHNAYNRFDYGVTNSLRLFASMNYGYYRQTGTLSGADAVPGSNYVNTSRTTDPNTLRSDAGTVNPLSIYTFGGDWTPTPKLVVSARYGYFFTNTKQRGTPVRHPILLRRHRQRVQRRSRRPGVPRFVVQQFGLRQHPEQPGHFHDAYKRKGFNVDASYFVHFAGTHTFKTGYFRSNSIRRCSEHLQRRLCGALLGPEL